MYTHSSSFNTAVSLHIHSAECTVRLLNKEGRNNYPYNHKFVGTPGIEPVTSGLTSVYQTSSSTT